MPAITQLPMDIVEFPNAIFILLKYIHNYTEERDLISSKQGRANDPMLHFIPI